MENFIIDREWVENHYHGEKDFTIPEGATKIEGRAFEDCESLKFIHIPKSVVEIGVAAFEGCLSLESIELPDGIPVIENYAFYCCENLKSIRIPDSVTEIGDNAFDCCYSLKSIRISDNVTKIGEEAFRGCRTFVSVEIPDSVTEIGKGAFCHCNSLESIHIPDSVARIGYDAFYGCDNLTIRCSKESYAEEYAKEHDISVEYNMTIMKSFVIDEEWTNENYHGEADFVIPDGVAEIENSAFRNCKSLESIEIPDRVTKIGEYAFCNCYSLKSIEIPDSVNEIDYGTFYRCESLEYIRIPDSVTKIGESAFRLCTSLKSIEIPKDVTKIGEYAFEHCSSLKSIEIPTSVTEIGDGAFKDCKNLTIQCSKGSYAEAYAKENNIPIKYLEEQTHEISESFDKASELPESFDMDYLVAKLKVISEKMIDLQAEVKEITSVIKKQNLKEEKSAMKEINENVRVPEELMNKIVEDYNSFGTLTEEKVYTKTFTIKEAPEYQLALELHIVGDNSVCYGDFLKNGEKIADAGEKEFLTGNWELTTEDAHICVTVESAEREHIKEFSEELFEKKAEEPKKNKKNRPIEMV